MSSPSRTQFEGKLNQRLENGKGKQLFTDQTLKATIQRWNEINAGIAKKETKMDYKIMTRYNVVKLGEESILVKRGQDTDIDQVEKYVSLEAMYNILLEAHIETGHGGRDRILHRLKERKILNITREIVEDFVNLCSECQSKKSFATKGIVVKPIVTERYGQRFQAGDTSTKISLG